MGYRKVYWEFGTAAKSSAVAVHSPALNAGNIAAQEALRAAFEAAVDAVSLGTGGSEQFIATETDVARTPSSNPVAQRENKWLVSFVDNVTGLGGGFTIPCYDPSLLGGDGESMDTGSTEYGDLVSATQAFVRSNAGNTVTVTSVRFRARTLG
jgi:hypothetical protein